MFRELAFESKKSKFQESFKSLKFILFHPMKANSQSLQSLNNSIRSKASSIDNHGSGSNDFAVPKMPELIHVTADNIDPLMLICT